MSVAPDRASRFRVRPLAVATLVALAASLAACAAPTPTADDYCGVVDVHRDRYLAAMSVADAGSLEGIITVVSAIGDLKIMWKELARVAPDEIRDDTEAVRDAWIEQEKAAAQGDLAGALATALLNSGSMGRVDAYIRENCAFADELIPLPIEDPNDLQPGPGWTVVGDLLMQGGYPGPSPTGASGAIAVFTPEGGPLAVDAAALFPGQEVVSQSWTVAGEPGESYLVGAIEIRVPASGLDPEAYTITIATVDPRSGSAALTNSFEVSTDECDGGVGYFVGSRSDAVAAAIYTGCRSEVFLYGWDPATGRELWTLDSDATSASLGTLVAAVFTDRCGSYSGVDVATGDILWVYDSNAMPVQGSCAEIQISDYVGNAAVYPYRAQQGYSYHLESRYTDDYAVDYATDGGEPVFIRQPFQIFDPVTEYAVVYGQDFGAGRDLGLQVYDTRTGETVYEIDVERMVALDARPITLIAGRLFLRTSDEYLEIDVDSGDIVREGATATGYALGVIGDYAYFSDGTLVPIDQINEYRPPA